MCFPEKKYFGITWRATRSATLDRRDPFHPWMFDGSAEMESVVHPAHRYRDGDRQQAGVCMAASRPAMRPWKKQRAEADRRRLGATDLSRDDSRTMIRCDMMHAHTHGPGRPAGVDVVAAPHLAAPGAPPGPSRRARPVKP